MPAAGVRPRGWRERHCYHPGPPGIKDAYGAGKPAGYAGP